MDADRFDSLTRTLTVSRSRRVTLRGLAAGVLLSLGLARDESTVLAKNKGNGNGNGNGKDKKKKDCPKSQPNRCGDKCCKTSQACKKGKCINHCNDEKQNFDETDIDCGGSCRKCLLLGQCEKDADCFNNVCVKSPNLAFPVCLECRESPDCGRLNNTLQHACHGGICLECSRDADCPRPGQREEQDKCVEPVDGSCPPGKPCVCAQCRNSVDCPQGQLCDETNTCIGNTCAAGQDLCRDGITRCNGNDECSCRRTAGQQSVCVSNRPLPGVVCRSCSGNSECDAVTGVPGSFCIDFGGTVCTICAETNNRGCSAPCPTSP